MNLINLYSKRVSFFFFGKKSSLNQNWYILDLVPLLYILDLVPLFSHHMFIIHNNIVHGNERYMHSLYL